MSILTRFGVSAPSVPVPDLFPVGVAYAFLGCGETIRSIGNCRYQRFEHKGRAIDELQIFWEWENGIYNAPVPISPAIVACLFWKTADNYSCIEHRAYQETYTVSISFHTYNRWQNVTMPSKSEFSPDLPQILYDQCCTMVERVKAKEDLLKPAQLSW